MQGDARLSLIVCTYRRAPEVEKLLRSLTSQTRLPDETLIVDASTDDETKRVVETFISQDALPKLTYYKAPPEHRGLTRQRNYGVERASGDLIAFLDDDTIPEPDYFAETVACFKRHPRAAGVGGYITNEVEWRQTDGPGSNGKASSALFKWGSWERREALRWRLRRRLGLVSTLAPGWVPDTGHGRPVGYLPPDGEDYEVEFFMGCSFAFRREVFDRQRFSSYFEGYGLYEDLDFCVRAARLAPLYLCTRARLAHYHAPSGRPNQFRYGLMVVRNGWMVWRRRWPEPPLKGRLGWWATTALLTLCRFAEAVGGPERLQSLTEGCGRVCGMASLFWKKPEETAASQEAGAMAGVLRSS
ncbi:MAG TPA: glycosyltransferase family 2 protein [Pyrinomonadaceae bacterium]|jgi:GT2 family glycosyltransferase